MKKEDFKFWGEDLEEDQKIMNAFLAESLKDWLNDSEEDKIWAEL